MPETESSRDLARVLDRLIDRYAAVLESQPDESVKLGEFLKLVEVRNKLQPDDTTQAKFWSYLEKVRSNELASKSAKKLSAKSRKHKKEKKRGTS